MLTGIYYGFQEAAHSYNQLRYEHQMKNAKPSAPHFIHTIITNYCLPVLGIGDQPDRFFGQRLNEVVYHIFIRFCLLDIPLIY